MTGKLDKRMRALGKRLIDDFGKPVTLRRTDRSYDAELGSTTETVTDYSVNGVLEDYSESRVDGTLVKSGDLRLTIPALDLAVSPDIGTDTIRFDGDSWAVVNARSTYSGEQVAVYELQIRK